LDLARKLANRGLHVLSVPHRHIVEDDFSLGWPAVVLEEGVTFFYKLVLGVKKSVLEDTLSAGHVVLDFSHHADGNAEVENDVGDDLKRENQHLLVQVVFQEYSAGCDAHSEEHAQHVQAEANPSMNHNKAESRVCRLLDGLCELNLEVIKLSVRPESRHSADHHGERCIDWPCKLLIKALGINHRLNSERSDVIHVNKTNSHNDKQPRINH